MEKYGIGTGDGYKQTRRRRVWDLTDLESGHHISLFFQTPEEHREVIVPFLRQGLENGERVIYIGSANSPETIERYLMDDGLDVESYRKNGQWLILGISDSFLYNGSFSPERMSAWLQEQVGNACNDDSRILRMAGEMDWVSDNLPDAYRVIWYENRLDGLFPDFPAIVLCQYDMNRFTPGILKDVMRNHPLIIANGELFENFYYVPVDIDSDEQPAAAELYHWLKNLEEQKRSHAALKKSYDELQDNQNAAINLMEDLSREIIERREAEEKLKTAVKEKEVLLMEIHHRVKNNLQIISSLLKLQAASVSDEDTIQALKDSRHRIRSMALVHERLYASSDFACIDIGDYISGMVRGLFATYEITGRVTLEVETNNVQLAIDNAIPCGLILNELVTNALKYAFPGERTGKLEIRFKPIDNNRLELTVKDDGVGIPEDMDIETCESLGFQLVNILTCQLEGNIAVERNEGTTFKIVFPG